MQKYDYIVQPEAESTAVSYAKAVLNGNIVTGKLVQKCCQRFMDDYDNGSARGVFFNKKDAQHAVDFFGFLRHTKGVWAKQIETAGFLLAPWQVFILANLFGFRLKSIDGQRRFREAYIEVARKNGKSTFISGIGLYMLFADGEPGAEVYSAATTKDQAKIIFQAAKDMVRHSPYLGSRIGQYRNNLHVDATSSKFEPLASDSKTLDGLNVHCALVDELHEHPTRALYDVLNTATGSRSQPLIAAITTAGFDREGICWDQRSYGIKILNGVIPDDNFFVYVASLDEGDDWKDEKNWLKANPNMGVSVSLEAIRPNFLKALEQPAAQNEFLRKHLNVWTESDTCWLVAGAWEKNCAAGTEHKDPRELRSAALETLRGRRCFGGLDISEVEDVTAFVLFFPPCGRVVRPVLQPDQTFVKMKNPPIVKCLPTKNARHLVEIGAAEFTSELPDKWPTEVIQESDDRWRILPWFWIPKAFIKDRMQKNRAPYDAWVRLGYITATEGNAIDQEAIRNIILEMQHHFLLGEVGYDKWGAEWIGPKLLLDGVKMVAVPQRFEFMSGPCKSLTGFINAGTVEHYNNPVLRWMASNVQLLLDTNGNQRPDKGASKSKIDGIVATILAAGRALANPAIAKQDDPERFRIKTI